jgi:transcriptional regulator with XRE-family HTH domain
MTTKALTTRRANAIRTIRLDRGLSVAELGRRAGLSRARMRAMEMHPPAIWKRLCRLADVMGCTTDALLGRADVQPEAPALGPEDRSLLKAMQRDAEQLIGGHPLLRPAGGWRRLARMMWFGGLTRIRDHGEHRPKASAPKPPPYPRGWFAGWESPRQIARGR